MGVLATVKDRAKLYETLRRCHYEAIPKVLDQGLSEKINAGLFAVFVENLEEVLKYLRREIFQRALV